MTPPNAVPIAALTTMLPSFAVPDLLDTIPPAIPPIAPAKETVFIQLLADIENGFSIAIIMVLDNAMRVTQDNNFLCIVEVSLC
jgi:hypothetical protein